MLISMRAWCQKAERISSVQTLDGFPEDEILQLAVTKAVQQVGEIARRVMERWPEFTQANPQLCLVDAYALRNRLVHGYHSVELKILYFTARESIPELGHQLDRLIGNADDRP
ncbi:MAG: DUF86 domain-containing protein [Hoeflea sp.]|nr:DUF86 domain-containing protein [Hoeflea sp.]